MGTPSPVADVVTLDTNVLIYYAAGDERVADFLLGLLRSDEEALLPTIAIVEFLSFPSLSGKDRALFTRLLGQLRIVPLDLEIALRAADLRAAHRLKLGDSVIAATALGTGSVLATRNIRDFKKVPKLDLLAF